MLEHETENFLPSYPNDFFGDKEFQFIDRQESFQDLGRFEAGPQKGSEVIFPSVLRWRAYGFDLMLANCELFDPSHFSTLIDSFEAAVYSRKNAGLVADLRRWASHYCTMSWPYQSNALLLQWAMADSCQSAVPQANAIWTYLFGSPAPTWYLWNESEKIYKFDHNRWQIWFNSLNQG